ncbi:MAG: NAD(P)H-hydrate dehydratase [Armatimonadota bacterium]|nr:MAG: NAD(P)H-hydrate dehydratase [Armatimonadota bacterium]
MKVVTAAQMRQIDRRAIEERDIPGRVLMENAGKAVADLVRRAVADPGIASAIVFCGRGNNGGDGFVVARHLAEWGMSVRVVLAARAGEVTGDAAHHLEAARKAAVPVVELAESLSSWCGAKPLADAAAQADILVDALLGTGVRGEVTGIIGELVDLINDSRKRGRGLVVAVDVPSGIDSDTGAVCGRAVEADHTVTMGLPKLGVLVGEGIAHTGELTVADIGFPVDVIAESPCEAELIERVWADSALPSRRRDAHKGDFGRVAVIAGSVGMTGAAVLCSTAALRMGAGLVTLGAPASLNDILEVKLTEVMTRPLPETPARTLSFAARGDALAFAREADVVIFGPGVSRNEETVRLIRDLVPAIERPLVLDADGINALSGDPSPLRQRQAPTVCTPHPGEMGRLLGASAEEVQRDRPGVARRAAADLGCVMLLKGAKSIVADSGGEVRISPTGNPGMASGGTGDVLAGMIGGLMAQGLNAFDAASVGAFFHGLAGDLAAEEKTEHCLIAGDLLDFLTAALKGGNRARGL